MLRLWKYILNTFLIETEGNYKKTYILAIHHIAKLAQQITVPEILAIYNYINPLWQTFDARYSTWLEAKANYKSSTRTLEFMLHQLASVDVVRWDVTIQSFYPKNTPQYINLMPNGRKPFYGGAYDVRIPALTSLANNIGSDANLQTVKNEVIAFQGNLLSKRNIQLSCEAALKNASTDLEASRITLMKGFYKNLGNLMSIYYETPETVQNYFDLSLIRKHINEEPTETFIGEVAANTSDNVVICDLAFTVDTKFIIINTGEIAFGVITVPHPNDQSTGIYTIIEPREQRTLLASELGVLTNKVLVIRNPNSEGTAHYKVIAVSLPEQPL